MRCEQHDPIKNGFDELKLNPDEERLLGAFNQFHALKLPEQIGRGLAKSDLRVLWQLYFYSQRHDGESGMPISELSASSHMVKAAVSRSLRQLEESGLIVRLPNTSDRRCAKVELTPKGTERIKSTMAQMKRIFDLIVERLPVEEIDQIIAGLSRLYEVINEAMKQLDSEKNDSSK